MDSEKYLTALDKVVKRDFHAILIILVDTRKLLFAYNLMMSDGLFTTVNEVINMIKLSVTLS